MLAGRRRTIIWSNAGLLLIGSLGTNFSELLFAIQTFSLKKIRLQVSFAKWQPFCLGLNVLTLLFYRVMEWILWMYWQQWLCYKEVHLCCSTGPALQPVQLQTQAVELQLRRSRHQILVLCTQVSVQTIINLLDPGRFGNNFQTRYTEYLVYQALIAHRWMLQNLINEMTTVGHVKNFPGHISFCGYVRPDWASDFSLWVHAAYFLNSILHLYKACTNNGWAH